ncbi:MAG TPA: hypothetical protein VKA92_03415, partial [Segetibacter sp.]|nr:hypothetical protein [Segetibacter sp.]
ITYAKFYTLPKYYPGADTWRFYRLSANETKWLLNDPVAFTKDLFTYSYSKSGNLFSGENSYWNDLKSNIVIKMMAVINVLTNNSYYTNIIFFNFLFLFGIVALFKLFNEIYPGKKWFIVAGVFLLPSTLFWCSGIHKDGLILSATGMIMYTFYKSLKIKFSIKRIIIIFLCLLILFSLRNYVLFALLPALLAWWLCEKYRGRNIKIFATVYTICIAVFFIVHLVFPSLNFPAYITNKRNEFLLLEGGSKVTMRQLEPNFISFVFFIPNAVDMAFLRPHPNEIKNFSFIPAVIEIIFLLFLLFISIVQSLKKVRLTPVVLFSLFFSISIMLLSGYTIPFTGAIVRYRSFVLPLLITPLLCITDFFSLKEKKTSVASKNINPEKLL